MLLVNGREIPVAVVRSRRARRYVLHLRENGLAQLTIPRNGSVREAWEFARRQKAWLERQLQYLAARPVRPKEWRVGTEFFFRGEPVKIEIASNSHFAADHPGNSNGSPSGRPSPPGEGELSAGDWIDRRTLPDAQARRELIGTRSRARLRQADFFPQLSPNRDASQTTIRVGSELIPVADPTGDLRAEIENHLRALATKELPAKTFEFAALHKLSVRRVVVRAQRSRWGSCSFKRVISLNWRLIQTPLFVRDYIILHELMHLRQMNHSARFWREVEAVCPEFRRAKSWIIDNPGLLEPGSG
jgi:predicted metal-dependent hydrolase